MKKYIHYCWFGDKPLPKLTKKCIKSWKKYLPDYEIIKWDESNVDLNECYFINEAYKNKKWAFVSDYVRTKVLYEHGGIYFDTDMEVIKNIDDLLKNNSFLGLEDSGYVAVGVWYEKEKNSILAKKLLEKYNEIKKIDFKNLSEYSNYSIPKLLSSVLEKFDLKYSHNSIQRLSNKTTIYPRDYFYPYSYDRSNNVFTDNTCMIHYYDASWIPLREKIQLLLVRKLGQRKAWFLINVYRRIKLLIKKIIKLILYPIIFVRNSFNKRKNIYNGNYIDRINSTINSINQTQSDYITIYNSNWLGVTNSTKELFENLVDCGEILRKSDVKKIGDEILKNNKSQVIFSSFAKGWKELAIYLKDKNDKIKLKTFWHGSNSQILDLYGWDRNKEIIDLHRKNIINVMGICKESMLNFYKSQNLNSYFITNKTIYKKVNKDINNDDTSSSDNISSNKNIIKIGLYAARCDDWRKNMYTQMLAISLIENAVVDMIPLNEDAIKFANSINLKYEGSNDTVSREELFERMSKNDVNLYVTLSECSPMLSLESFEVGVPCVVGNNCHYFKDQEIEKDIVVFNEDNAIEIKDKIMNCLNNKKGIIKKYKLFAEKNTRDSNNRVDEFIGL